jgi:hypothetical protein
MSIDDEGERTQGLTIALISQEPDTSNGRSTPAPSSSGPSLTIPLESGRAHLREVEPVTPRHPAEPKKRVNSSEIRVVADISDPLDEAGEKAGRDVIKGPSECPVV